jgi:hypothetical protein
VPELAALVAAVRERTPELERLIREAVDVELERLVAELVEREPSSGRTASDRLSSSTRRRPRRSAAARATRRSRARRSHRAARRVATARLLAQRGRSLGLLAAKSDVVDREARRALLDELRQNGVEYVERDGQSFRVLRLLGTNAGLASRVDRRREASRLSLL